MAAKVKEHPLYNKGDLVKVSFDSISMYWLDTDNEDGTGYGIIVGRTSSWYEAYESKTRTNDPFNDGTRFWNNVNYCTYRVMMVGTGDFEWVGPDNLELVS